MEADPQEQATAEIQEGIDPQEHAEAELIKQTVDLVSPKPDIAIEQAFYLIRLGSDIILNINRDVFKKSRAMLLANEVQQAAEALKYVHMKLGQLEMAARWMRDQSKPLHKGVQENLKVANKALQEKSKS